MNKKIKISLLSSLIFLAHFALAITFRLAPSSFACGIDYKLIWEY